MKKLKGRSEIVAEMLKMQASKHVLESIVNEIIKKLDKYTLTRGNTDHAIARPNHIKCHIMLTYGTLHDALRSVIAILTLENNIITTGSRLELQLSDPQLLSKLIATVEANIITTLESYESMRTNNSSRSDTKTYIPGNHDHRHERNGQ